MDCSYSKSYKRRHTCKCGYGKYTYRQQEADVTILAMERGAIDFVAKPTNIIEAKGEAFKRQLLGVLNAVLATQKAAESVRPAVKPAAKAPMMRKATGGKNKLVALACSTGDRKRYRV